MARLRFAHLIRDIDLVVFDKDGTLIDFDFTWSPRCIAAVDALIAERAARAALKDQLLSTMGIDPLTRRALTESPLVVGTVAETVIVAATVLYQAGEAWSDAILSAHRHVRVALTTPPLPNELSLFAPVMPLMNALTNAGVAIAVLTNDERVSTMSTLAALGLLPFISYIACADDPHGGKPEPGGLLHLAATANVPINRVAMVGDAIGDLITARRAGAAVAVGVLTGTTNRDQLEPHADAILDDVGQIEVLYD